MNIEKILRNNWEKIENYHDQFRQKLNDQKTNPSKHLLMQEIDQWEKNSIEKIKQTAEQCRMKLINYINRFSLDMEKNLKDSAEQIKEMRQGNDYNEIDLKHLTQRLQKLRGELDRPVNVSVEQQPTSFINNISVLVPFHSSANWKPLGITSAGGKGRGNQLDQLSYPGGICIDANDETIYIADCGNARIMEWKVNATNGRIVAGEDGSENQTNQLAKPAEVVIDREDNSFIISDMGNRRVMRWARQANSNGQIIISNIDCYSLAIHKDGSLYVSDWKKHEVKRWRRGETNIVAGGNGQGNGLNQLNNPKGVFVNDEHTLYISDSNNHRVMKWMKDAKEGVVVAGGNDQGNNLTQLSYPDGVIVDQFDQVYVADTRNNRVMRWDKGAKEGIIIVGDNNYGSRANQFNGPVYLSFDSQKNLYVVDCKNHRIQKFAID